MRKYLLATVACLTIASPAVAKDGSGYVGFELGALFPHDPSGKAFVDFTTTNATVPPGGTLPAGIPAGPADFTFNNTFYKTPEQIELIGEVLELVSSPG